MFSYLFLVNSVIAVFANLAENGVFSCSSKHGNNRFHEFRCQNGTCIDYKYVCDGIQHCPEASDEIFCKYSRKRSKRANACILPAYPRDGTYEVLSNPSARPGQTLDSFLLSVRCRRGYGVINRDGTTGTNGKAFCVNGVWDQQMPKCVRFCKLNPDPSVRFMCHTPGVGLQVCGNYVAPGTLVSPVCSTPIYYSTKSFPNMRCINGIWNYVAQCEAECGRVTPEGYQLIIDGKEAKRGELPWHVGIYRKKSDEQICGGSLISNNVVISAAHCFWSDVRKLLPASDYKVAVGKLHRDWDSDEEVGVQKSDVKEIKIPTLFEGQSANFQEDIAVLVLSTPFVYKIYIRPVCLNFDINFERFQLQHDNLGKVAGWGLTAANGDASPVLKVVDMPFINEFICIKALPPSFREYLTGDKFCAGYTNGTALCKGDSGGGLAFADRELGIDRYYLRGIVSAAPRNDEKKCNDNAYTTFTKITKHQHLINEVLAESASRGCPFYSFQCDDGSCVDLGSDCNGRQDCADGSDETDEVCRPTAVTSKPSVQLQTGACILPPYPNEGKYVVQNFTDARPGQRLENFALTVTCSVGYEVIQESGLRSRDKEIYCYNGLWYEKMPKCVPAECGSEGIKGQCVPSNVCPSTLDNSLQLPKPSPCFRTSNKKPLVCCTDCELIKDNSVLLNNPVLGILIKTGTSKAKDKCLEYINTLDYACKRDSSRNITVQFDPFNRCYRKVNVRQKVLHIKGTKDALREEFPHMALLGYGERRHVDNFTCGGSIISERFILTGVYCLYDRLTESPVKYIAVGMLKRSDPPEFWQHYDVKRIIRHPKYDSRLRYHDIALLETDREITFSSAVLPACLHVDDKRDMHAYFTGWGIPAPRSDYSDTLRSIYQVSFSAEECTESYPLTRVLRNGIDNNTQMCYGQKDDPDSPCTSDRGGPLQSQDHELCVYTVIGVLSLGWSCYTKDVPSVYTRVKYYVPWIEENVWP